MTYAWVEIGDGRSVYRRVQYDMPKRAAFPCPMISLDTMDPIQSMASGKMYDSKSALRSEYKQMGMIEVGNDPARLRAPQKRKPDRKAIRESLMKAKARVSA